MIGRTIGHYEIIEKIGEGGMGAVYKARDIHLDRSVALKMLPGESVANSERKRRFALEAKAASALNHPNIITIYDIDVADGVDFIAMEYVAGHTLADLIPPAGMEPARAIQFGAQIADALATAHQSGIVHRDLKPSNIMVNEQGRVKVLDFGLAKLIEPVSGEGAATRTASTQTREGTILGTVAYMAPEQAEGKPVDQRADIFSFGAVLYEMLSGVQPFRRDSALGTLAAIVRDEPPALDAARIPPAVRQVVKRALEKNPEARYASGAELASALASVSRAVAPRGALNRRWLAAGAAAVVVAAVLGGWNLYKQSRVDWARREGLPQIARLLAGDQGFAAFDLAQQVGALIPDDPNFQQAWAEAGPKPLVQTDPEGAEVYIRELGAEEKNPWRHVGTSPIKDVPLPRGYFLWKAVKPGFAETTGAAPTWWSVVSLRLAPEGEVPDGMVLVPGADSLGGMIGIADVEGPHDPYFIDRYEVTNRQFKQFVDQGGYQKREYWKTPFVRDGKPVSWDEAMAVFRDTTGRPGPSTWEGGTFPTGKDDFPVTGVSWYRGGSLRGVRGQEPANDLPLVPGRRYPHLTAADSGQQFRRQGSGERGQLREHRTVRNLRHGRERPGMDVERDRWRIPFHPRRVLEQPHLPVQPARRQAAFRPRLGKRLPLRAVPHAAASIVARDAPAHVPRLFAREACRRRGLPRHPRRLRVRPARVEGRRGRG